MGCCGGGKVAVQGPGVAVSCPDGERRATPAAEVMARARGINLCSVTPTGQGGKVIQRQDVLRWMAAR